QLLEPFVARGLSRRFRAHVDAIHSDPVAKLVGLRQCRFRTRSRGTSASLMGEAISLCQEEAAVVTASLRMRARANPKAVRAAAPRATQGSCMVGMPTFSLEVITLPVNDVDRALRFYVEQVGFTLDVDYAPTDSFRVVQLTPPGSSCSIQLGTGLTDAPAGSVRNVYLVVDDLEAARSRLLERAVTVGGLP